MSKVWCIKCRFFNAEIKAEGNSYTCTKDPANIADPAVKNVGLDCKDLEVIK